MMTESPDGIRRALNEMASVVCALRDRGMALGYSPLPAVTEAQIDSELFDALFSVEVAIDAIERERLGRLTSH